MNADSLLLLLLWPALIGIGYLIYRVSKSWLQNYGEEQEKRRMSTPGPLGLTAFEGMPLKPRMGNEFSELFRGKVDDVEVITGLSQVQSTRDAFPRRFVFARLPVEVPHLTISQNNSGPAVRESSFEANDLFGTAFLAVGGRKRRRRPQIPRAARPRRP
jgi:hypothetical protein